LLQVKKIPDPFASVRVKGKILKDVCREDQFGKDGRTISGVRAELGNIRQESTKKKLGISADWLRRQRYQVATLGIIDRWPRRFSAGD
jgi:hypothetical protein